MPPFTIVNSFFGPVIVRARDGAFIPFDPANRDYQDYLAWVAAGSPPTWNPTPWL